MERGRWRLAVGGVSGVVKGMVINMPGLNKHDDKLTRMAITVINSILLALKFFVCMIRFL